MKKALKRCEHCNAVMQIYRYPIGKEIIKPLWLLRYAGMPVKLMSFHSEISPRVLEKLPLLRFWGLIAESSEPHYWYLTTKGENFLDGEISVPKYVWLYRNESVAQPEGDETVNINVFAHDLHFEPYNKEMAINTSSPQP